MRDYKTDPRVIKYAKELLSQYMASSVGFENISTRAGAVRTAFEYAELYYKEADERTPGGYYTES